MATFRVGQRVRVVSRHPTSRAPVGLEGVIAAIDDFCGKNTGILYPYHVEFGIPAHDIEEWHYSADMLRPILSQPERNTVVTWESLGLDFDPRKIAEVA